MTFAEMRYEAEILFESITSGAAPGFNDAEWGVIFTAAQRKLVLDILNEGVARNTRNSLILTPLITAGELAVADTDDFYLNSDDTPAQTIDTAVVHFPDEIFWILDEYVETAEYDRIPLLSKTYEFYQKNLDNPFNSPDLIEGFWVIRLNDASAATEFNRPVFISNGIAITKYHYIGVEHPDNYEIALGSDCILHESIHGEIVSTAVKLAHQSVIDPNGFQLAVAGDSLSK